MNVDYILKNIDLVIIGGSLIVIPIVMFVKIKLNGLTNLNDKYFPSVEKYEKQFKEHTVLMNEQVKKPNSNKGGW